MVPAQTSNLDKYLHTVRRIEEHREEKSVQELAKLYKQILVQLRGRLGNVYSDYAQQDGTLTYAQLHADGMDARLLEEIVQHMNITSAEEQRLIRETVEQTYQNCYSGMVQAVEKVSEGDGTLQDALGSVESVKPEVIRAAVDNPVHGLTLSDELEKNRATIIYDIKQAIGVGLSNGDNYQTMTKRVQHALVGDDGRGGGYAKSVRIVRTEAHRVREQGNHEAAEKVDNELKKVGWQMVKIWHTMKDERVRPNRSRKTKHGWKYSKGSGIYNHVKMEGVTVPVDEEFTLPSGAKTKAPGQSGVAGEDINCRCFLSYEMQQLENYKRDDIIKLENSGLENGLPLTSNPFSVIDKTDRNGKVLQRREYDSQGRASIDYDTSDHGRPDLHPHGAHKHNFDYSGKKQKRVYSDLTDADIHNNSDIVKRGKNYHD